MTKLRAPLSPHRALTKVAALIGWDKAGAIVNKAERTVRNWSDPETAAGVTLEAGLALDRAFVVAGGEGAPFFAWYQLQLGIQCSELVSTSRSRLERAATAAKETGEALAAQMMANRPGASATDLAIAKRETEEAIAALSDTLASLDVPE